MKGKIMFMTLREYAALHADEIAEFEAEYTRERQNKPKSPLELKQEAQRKAMEQADEQKGKLKMNEIVINNTSLGIKEYNGQRVVTFKDIDSVHNRPEGTARKRFNDNKKHFVEGEDFFKVCVSEIRTSKIMDISPKVQSDMIFLTESGYLMLVKSFTDELAWSVQRQLVKSYFRVQQIQPKQLSPIEMIAGIANNAVAMERRLAEQEKAIAGTNQRIDDMCEIMKPVSDDWRPAMNKLVKRIAECAEYPIDALWVDIYDEVDIRAGVHLDTRLKKLRNRMWERGTAWSAVERLNKLDVIQQDKKLIAIYVGVVKEFATKYIGKKEI